MCLTVGFIVPIWYSSFWDSKLDAWKLANVKTRWLMLTLYPTRLRPCPGPIPVFHPTHSLYPKLNLLLTCRVFSSWTSIFISRIVILLFFKVSLDNPETPLPHIHHLFLSSKSPRKYSYTEKASCLLSLSAFALSHESHFLSWLLGSSPVSFHYIFESVYEKMQWK